MITNAPSDHLGKIATSCPPMPTPDVPQSPVPIPATPPPNWLLAPHVFINNGIGHVPLNISFSVGDNDGYSTWAQAVESAKTFSSALNRSISIMDHEGRLYLRLLDLPSPLPWILPSRPYTVGMLGERRFEFPDDSMRGIVQDTKVYSRGDCLADKVRI